MKYYIYVSLLQLLFINLIFSTSVTFLKNKTKLATNSTETLVAKEEEPKIYKGFCLMKIQNTFYDLTPLWALNEKSAWKIFTKSGEQINFNICGRNAPSVCSNKNAMVISNIKCTEYAGDSQEERAWTLSSNANKKAVLSLRLPKGEICRQNGAKPEFFRTTYEFKPAVGSILILIGLYFMILGNSLWKFNNFIINFGIQGLIIYSFLNVFFNVNMLICMFLGLAVALGVFYFGKAAAISLGIVVGYLFGTLSYNIFVKLIPMNPQTLYWTLIILSIIGLATLGGFIDQYMIVLATSLVGGYSLVRGISLFAGNYPDETYVMKLINSGEYTQFGRVYGKHIYIYMFGIFFATGVGFLIQSFLMPKEEASPQQSASGDEKSNNTEKKENQTTTNAPTEKKEEKASEQSAEPIPEKKD